MSKWLTIAAYRCHVDGVVNGSVDFQVRYFELPSPSDVEAALRSEHPHEYKNHLGETVSWSLARILGIQGFLSMASGDEIAGFIAGIEELSALGLPDPG